MNKNKGIIGIGLIIAIVLGIVVVGGGAYYFIKVFMINKVDCCTDDQLKELNKNSQQDQNQAVVENKKDSSLSSEESSTETFKEQPGAIKSIKADGANKWILSVDLLSNNPNWFPGGDDIKGEFFINQNSKIRDLNISSSTKIQNCTTQYSDYASGFENSLLSFITYANSATKKVKEEFGYTAYFDINGTNITAVYEQCLP